MRRWSRVSVLVSGCVSVSDSCVYLFCVCGGLLVAHPFGWQAARLSVSVFVEGLFEIVESYLFVLGCCVPYAWPALGNVDER